MADFDGSKIEFQKDLTLEKQLGSGAFGTIWKASWKNHSEPVAVKKLNLQIATTPIEQFRAFTEFRREVWLMRYLLH
jgi:serine/threonine protein kinase